MKKLMYSLLVSLGLVFVVPGSAAAWNPFGEVDCSVRGSANSAVCKDSRGAAADPVSGPDGIILKIANVVAVVAGIAAVIIIVLAGLRMVTSSGSSEDIAGARRTLIYAIVGIIVIVLARTIIGLVLGML